MGIVQTNAEEDGMGKADAEEDGMGKADAEEDGTGRGKRRDTLWALRASFEIQHLRRRSRGSADPREHSRS